MPTDTHRHAQTWTGTETHADTVFFHEKVSQGQPQEERLKESKFIIVIGPRDRMHGTPHRAMWDRHPGGQDAGARGVLSAWPLLRFLWERQGDQGEQLGLASLNNFGGL